MISPKKANASCVTLLVTLALGVVTMAVSYYIYSTRVGRETAVWYNVPLCPTLTPGECGAACTRHVSSNLDTFGGPTAQAACLAELQETDTEAVSFPVPRSLFMEGQEYTLSAFRHPLSKIVALDVELVTPLPDGGPEATVFRISHDWRSMDSSSPSTATASAPDLDDTPIEFAAATGADDGVGETLRTGERRLLKGGGFGGSSGSRYRRRNTYHGRSYGRRTRTRLGWTSDDDAVASATNPLIVHVYTRAALASERGGLMSFVRGLTGQSSCLDPASGCEIELTNSLSRDEYVTSDFVFRRSFFAPESYLRVKSMVVDVTSTTLTAPQVFLSFATDGSDWRYTAGDLYLPLGIGLTVLSGVLLIFFHTCVHHVDGDLRAIPRPSACNVPHRSFITSINYKSNDIRTAVGVEHYPNLVHLNLVNNDVRDLDGVSRAPHLAVLLAGNNDLSTLDEPLPPLLRHLDVNSNDIRSLARASTCHSLRILDASNNDLENLNGIERYPNLRVLKLASNDLTDVRQLAALSQLEELDLRNNDLSDVRQLLGLGQAIPTLRLIDVRNNDYEANDVSQLLNDFAVHAPQCRVIIQ